MIGGARRSPPKRRAALAKRCSGLASCRVAIQATSRVATSPKAMMIGIRTLESSPQLRSGGVNDSQLPSRS
ncbi:hypothetical protein D3C76_1382690 [compost metagenome]